MWGCGVTCARAVGLWAKKVSVGIRSPFCPSFTMAYLRIPVSVKVSVVSVRVSVPFTELTGVTVKGTLWRYGLRGRGAAKCGPLQKNSNGKPNFTEITERH